MQEVRATWRNWTLRLPAMVALALFAFFLALTFRVPHWVETAARDFIASEVRSEVGSRLDALLADRQSTAVEAFAAELLQQNRARAREIQQRLASRIESAFRTALDEISDPSCECRRRIEAMHALIEASSLAALLSSNARIRSFIQATYMDVANDLRREFRIFTATNAAVFLVLLLVSFAKPAAIKHLWAPGALLFIATVICAYWYLFSQDWLFTVIHGSYLGWAYAGWLATAFALLLDIALNRARVTTEIINGIGSAISSTFSALSPC